MNAASQLALTAAKERGAMAKDSFSRQAYGQSLVDGLIAVMIGVIVGVGVVIPIVENVTASLNVGGTTETILSFISTLIAAVIIMAVVSLMR